MTGLTTVTIQPVSGKSITTSTAFGGSANIDGFTIGASTAATVSATGIINVNNTTDATNKTDGSLQTDGGLSVAKSVVIGDEYLFFRDAYLQSREFEINDGVVEDDFDDFEDFEDFEDFD